MRHVVQGGWGQERQGVVRRLVDRSRTTNSFRGLNTRLEMTDNLGQQCIFDIVQRIDLEIHRPDITQAVLEDVNAIVHIWGL